MFLKPKGPYCQSCSIPLSKDPAGGGREVDGSRSVTYCGYCYDEGKFRNPDMSLSQMEELVRRKMKEMHLPGFIINFMVKDLPNLARWRAPEKPRS